MSTAWDPDLYLRFQRERTQPSIDLVARIETDAPTRIIDVGCGPGNSTRVLWERWPEARVIGLDNSPDMIAKARADYPERDWVEGDARAVPSEAGRTFELVYSNAVIQWIPEHETLLPALFGLVEEGGALALQIPCYGQMPIRRAVEEVAGSGRWRDRLHDAGSILHYYDIGFYYDTLSSLATTVALWQTDYIHEMPSHEAIVEMIRSTGLRPYLERLDSEADRQAFTQDVLAAVREAYPARPNGHVLFPFERLFAIAYR